MGTSDHAEVIEKAISQLREAGMRVEIPSKPVEHYSLVARRGDQSIAVKILTSAKRVTAPEIDIFSQFLRSKKGEHFVEGYLLSAGGFANTALAKITSWGTDCKIRCFERRPPFGWINAELPEPFAKTVRIGVFASKGGVGKTTIAAHLSGALGLHGCNVDLIDIDPQQNLKELVSERIMVPTPFGISAIEVHSVKDWEPKPARRKAFMFDCSPVFHENPEEAMKKINVFIVPVTLNPAGLGREGAVITRSVNEIRAQNKSARIFVIANDLDPSILDSPRAQQLREIILAAPRKLSKPDPKLTVLDPREIAIRSTNLLKNWGVSMMLSPEDESTGLAFPLRGRSNRPLEDFMRLAEKVVDTLS